MGLIEKLRDQARYDGAVPWPADLLEESADAMAELHAALQAAIDSLEVLRRGYGTEVSGHCYPALNVGREALDRFRKRGGA